MFTYGNTAWPDQLTAVNGSPLTYDAAGNRTSYDGWNYSWRAGRQLANMSDGTTSLQFQYDSDGIRTQKIVNGVTTQYTTLDGTITGQSDGTTTIQFIYTEDGMPFAMVVNGEPYLYVTNLQGDVTMVTDRNGLPLCSYTYDAWGNVLSITGEDTAIGELNPIRYRGYYQDIETGLYYLQSRYYDPTTMRFINADDPNIIQMGAEEKQELNLYAYCVNDPVNRVDPTGYDAIYLLDSKAVYNAGHAALLVSTGLVWYYFSFSGKINWRASSDWFTFGIGLSSRITIKQINSKLSSLKARSTTYNKGLYFKGNFYDSYTFLKNSSKCINNGKMYYNLTNNNCSQIVCRALALGIGPSWSMRKENQKAFLQASLQVIPNKEYLFFLSIFRSQTKEIK